MEKIVDKKKKKENVSVFPSGFLMFFIIFYTALILQRSQLLQALSEVQADAETIKELTSIATIQTKGLRKIFLEQEAPADPRDNLKRSADDIQGDTSNSLNSISGSKRRKALLRAGLWKPDEETKDSGNLNVVGFEV